MRHFLWILSFVLLVACKEDSVLPYQELPTAKGTVSLKLEHIWGEESTTFYTNTWFEHPLSGDSLNFEVLRYYLSGFYFIKAGSGQPDTVKLPLSARLIAVNGGIFTIDLNDVPAGEYQGMGFYVGLPSALNQENSTDRDLNPAFGMYRNVADGYNFVLASGISPSANQGRFHLELFGSAGAHPALREVSLSFANEVLKVNSNSFNELEARADISTLWLPTTGNFCHCVLTEPGPETDQVATQWGASFAFDHLH